MKIFISGFSGVGKSTLARELAKKGYAAHDLEDIEGLFKGRRKDTGEPLNEWDNADLETVKNLNWICNIDKLKEFLDAEKAGISFYSGGATNIEEVLPLFDKIILLHASEKTIRERLDNRGEDNDFGRTKEVQDHLFKTHKETDTFFRSNGAIEISADCNLGELTNKVIQAAK